MSFLMGLNDSYSEVRGQLLLMDPLPPINKVFFLVSQEERQRTIGSQLTSTSDTTNTVAFAVYNDSNRISNSGSHRSQPNGGSNKLGANFGGSHLVGTYRNPSNCFVLIATILAILLKSVTSCMVILLVTNINSSFHLILPIPPCMVNQISSGDEISGQSNSAFISILQSLNIVHCQQLLSLLSNHLFLATHLPNSTDTHFTSYTVGICSSISLNLCFSSSQIWVVDLSASCHICSHMFSLP